MDCLDQPTIHVPLDRGVIIACALALFLLVLHAMLISVLDFAQMEPTVDQTAHASPLHMILDLESHAPLSHTSTVLDNSSAT